MHTKKALLATGVSTIVGLAAFAGVASAQTTGTTGGQQTLAEKIAAKFNLNKDDVQKVFDEDRSAHEAEHQQKMEERLTQAVKDGKITASQKSQILTKQQELKSYMDSIKDKSAEERKALMRAKFDELKKWAEQNNLSDYFMPMKGGRGPHGGMPLADTPNN